MNAKGMNAKGMNAKGMNAKTDAPASVRFFIKSLISAYSCGFCSCVILRFRRRKTTEQNGTVTM